MLLLDDLLGDFNDTCHGLLPLVSVIKKIVRILWMLIPIALILFGIIDLGRAVISSDEKEISGAKSRLLKRVLYAVAVFLVVGGVQLILSLLGNVEGIGEWKDCWPNA